MVKHSKSPIFSSIARVQSRLVESPSYFPLVSFVSFGLFLLCSTYVIPAVSMRIFSLAQRPVVAAEPAIEGPIYISVAPNKERVIATVNDRNFDLDPKNMDEEMNRLISFLQEKTKEQMIKVGLELQIAPARTEAVLAVDSRLKYVHVQPIIAALAMAKIHRYGFETIILE
jgi:hypothetical protein